MQERLQKILAAVGIASRRDAEAYITAGRVTVNGVPVTELGRRVDPETDEILVDGRPIPREVAPVYVLLHKPSGYVTTRRDRHASHTVMELIREPLEARLGQGHPAVEGLHPVGRLDALSEGLLILTNDGAFTHAITHPSHGVSRVYLAEVRGIPDAEDLRRLREGIPLFGHRTRSARVTLRRMDRARKLASVEIELREGRNQQVRRMLQAVGHPVTRLKRVAIGSVELGRLKPGQWRFLTPAEVATLRREAAGADVDTPGTAPEHARSPRGGRPSGRGSAGTPRPPGSGRPPRGRGAAGGPRDTRKPRGGRGPGEERRRGRGGHGAP